MLRRAEGSDQNQISALTFLLKALPPIAENCSQSGSNSPSPRALRSPFVCRGVSTCVPEYRRNPCSPRRTRGSLEMSSQRLGLLGAAARLHSFAPLAPRRHRVSAGKGMGCSEARRQCPQRRHGSETPVSSGAFYALYETALSSLHQTVRG